MFAEAVTNLPGFKGSADTLKRQEATGIHQILPDGYGQAA